VICEERDSDEDGREGEVQDDGSGDAAAEFVLLFVDESGVHDVPGAKAPRWFGC
jgi:hypothetical protein